MKLSKKSLFPIAGLVLLLGIGAFLVNEKVEMKGRADGLFYDYKSEAMMTDVAVTDAANLCSQGDGTVFCRCYCRVTLTNCENGESSNSSVPLCKNEWDQSGDCAQISYVFTDAGNARQCEAKSGGSCSGHVRPGNGNPAELANQEVTGTLIGCDMITGS